MTLTSIVALSAKVTTYGMFLSPIPTCIEFTRKGASDAYSIIPFLTNFLCGFLWMQYGMLKNDQTIIQVNMVNLALQSIYILFYLFYSRKIAVNVQKILIFASVGLAAWVLMLFSPVALAAARLGPICTLVNILAFASPLAGLQEVLQSKSTATLPFPLIFMGLLVSAQWFFYGILVRDVYLQVPNAFGVILSLIQLSLFYIYPSRKRVE